MKKLLAVLIVLAFVAPAVATAAEWNMYGSARLTMMWYDRDAEQAIDGTHETLHGQMDGVNDDLDLRMDVQNNARIGAKVKASDQVSGRFEYGSTPNLRLLYGVYNFGSGTLTVGQDYTPAYMGISSQAGNANGSTSFDDTNLLRHGIPYQSRQPQITLRFGGLAVGLVQNEGSVASSTNRFILNTVASPSYTTTDILIPKIEVAYTFKNDMLTIKPFAGYQTFDVESAGITQTSESISAWLIGVGGKVNLGPAYVNFTVYYSQNPADYGIGFAPGAGNAEDASTARAAIINGKIEDSTAFGAALVVGFKVNDMLRLEAGYGYVTSEFEALGVDVTDNGMTYYIQAPITLTKGVTIYPEIGVVDDDEAEVGPVSIDQGKTMYYGFKFQIDF